MTGGKDLQKEHKINNFYTIYPLFMLHLHPAWHEFR